VRPSVAAMYKWIDLYPDKDIEKEFWLSKRVGKKTKRKILEACPSWINSIRYWRGVYRTKAPCGAVFLVAKNEFIVDVLRLE